MILNVVNGYDRLLYLAEEVGHDTIPPSQMPISVSSAPPQPNLSDLAPSCWGLVGGRLLPFYPSLPSTVRVLRAKMTPHLHVAWVLLRLLYPENLQPHGYKGSALILLAGVARLNWRSVVCPVAQPPLSFRGLVSRVSSVPQTLTGLPSDSWPLSSGWALLCLLWAFGDQTAVDCDSATAVGFRAYDAWHM